MPSNNVDKILVLKVMILKFRNGGTCAHELRPTPWTISSTSKKTSFLLSPKPLPTSSTMSISICIHALALTTHSSASASISAPYKTCARKTILRQIPQQHQMSQASPPSPNFRLNKWHTPQTLSPRPSQRQQLLPSNWNVWLHAFAYPTTGTRSSNRSILWG